jgi:hypothetical protein
VLEANRNLNRNNIIVAGDFNIQLGDRNPSGSPRLSTNRRYIPRNSPIVTVLRKHSLAPLAGRWALAARTSRPLGTRSADMTEDMGAESDYIFAAEALPADEVDTPAPPSWQAIAAATSPNFTHRPIFANLQTAPKAPLPAAPSPQPGAGYPQSGAPSTRTQKHTEGWQPPPPRSCGK